jgi:hypothetical protein
LRCQDLTAAAAAAVAAAAACLHLCAFCLQEEFINKSSAALADFVEEYPEQFDMRTMNTTDMKHIFSLVSEKRVWEE